MQLKRHSVSPGREVYDRRTGTTLKKREKTGFGSLQGSLNGASENSFNAQSKHRSSDHTRRHPLSYRFLLWHSQIMTVSPVKGIAAIQNCPLAQQET